MGVVLCFIFKCICYYWLFIDLFNRIIVVWCYFSVYPYDLIGMSLCFDESFEKMFVWNIKKFKIKNSQKNSQKNLKWDLFLNDLKLADNLISNYFIDLWESIGEVIIIKFELIYGSLSVGLIL